MRLIFWALTVFLGFGAVAEQGIMEPPPSSQSVSDEGTPESESALQYLLTTPFPNLQGASTRLSDWRNKTLLVNFWATWCAPCREELSVFSRLQTEFSGKNIQFVGIGLDSADKIQKFSEKHPVVFPMLIDDRQELARLFKALGNPFFGLPFTLMIDPKEKIAARKLGRLSEQELRLWLQKP